jgi:DNA-binding MarR family transcriptional regulator
MFYSVYDDITENKRTGFMAHFDDTTIAVYRFIEQHWQEHAFSPTLREIAAACYLSPGGVVLHLDKLEQAGCIAREANTARTIRILKALPETLDTTEALYVFIAERVDQGEAPSQTEMATAFHISEQTIRTLLKRLEEAGLIQRRKHVSRSILLLKK